MNFSSSGPALILKDQTDLSMENIAGLQAEADEIMDLLKIDTEQAHINQAVASANSEPTGIILKQGLRLS